MKGRPPRSPLFPYTPLFRSPSALTRRTVVQVLAAVPLGTGWRAVDRKSTRLNSSHANISYAVFCLKKKKNRLIPTRGHHRAAPQQSVRARKLLLCIEAEPTT